MGLSFLFVANRIVDYNMGKLRLMVDFTLPECDLRFLLQLETSFL